MQLRHGVDRKRVLLAIDSTGGKRRLRVGPAHLSRIGAERGEGVVEQRRADHADLQALQVLRLANLVLGVGELAEAVLAPGQRHDVLGGNDLEQLLARLTARQCIDRLIVRHQERHREQVQLRHLRRPVDGRADRHIDDALAHGGEFLGLIAGDELGAGIDLHHDAAVGALLHEIGPALRRQPPREGHADHGRDLVFALVILSFSRRAHE